MRDKREEQSEAAKQEAEAKRNGELRDLRDVLNVPAGFRFVCRLLAHCGTFGTIWSPSAEIHRNSGRQDVGHFIFGEVVQASPETLTKIVLDIKKEQDDEVIRQAKEKKR